MGIGDWIKGAVAQINPFDGGKNFNTYNPKKKKEEDVVKPSTLQVVKAPNSTNQLQAQKPNNAFQSPSLDLRLPSSTTVNQKPAGIAIDMTPTVPSSAIKITPNKTPQQSIPGFSVMSPAAQKAALSKLAREKALQTSITTQNDKKLADNEKLKTLGSIPIIGTAANWGARLAAAYGGATGNKKLEDDANDKSNLYTLGMTTEELNQYDDETKKKLDVLKNVVTGAGALDIVGATSLLKAPIIGGIKQAAKEGIKTQASKEILKTAVKETTKQYGKNVAIGGAVSGVADPAIQAYIKDGEVDWSSVPSSVLQGSLWAAAMPEFSGKARLVQKMRSGAKLTADESQLINQAIKGVEEGGQATGGTKIQVQQPRDIPVSDGSPAPFDVPVSVNTSQPTQKPIVEVSGDTPGVNQINVPTSQQLTTDRFNSQPASNPDRRVDGFTPKNTGNTGFFTRAEVFQEQEAVKRALNSGEIDRATYDQIFKDLDEIVPIDDPAMQRGDNPVQKIDVKEVKSIPVVDQTVVPTDLPEAPGQVRVTSTTAPNQTRSADVAAGNTPVALPADVQNVLDNPKRFNKVQVAAARNQRKLARQMAKTQEETAEAIERINVARPDATSNEGFVPTGVFSKGQNGNVRENMNINSEKLQAQQETANMSPSAVLQEAMENKRANNAYTARDFRNIQALFDTKRVTRDMPEYGQLRAALKDIGSQAGQFLREQGQAIRRTASADEIIGRFESKLYGMVDDPTKIDSRMFEDVEAATLRFTETRDDALRAYNQFTENPTTANAQAYHAAQDAAEQADKASKITEFKVASAALKGNKDVKQAREIEKLAQSADMYQMDAVDASMLSSTGTFVRNFVNAGVGAVEEGLTGGIASRIAGKVTGQNVGGGMSTKNVSGFMDGAKNIVDASKARAEASGMNPLEHAKNWATTGNQLGDTIIDSQVKHNIGDHYTQLLAKEGYTGQELKDRAGVMARQDPDEVGQIYTQTARVSAGLGSGVTRNNKIETTVKNIISDAISGGQPNKYSEGAAKLITRMTLGFPTAIGRSLAEGGKRFTLGAPTFVKAFRESDPQARALLIKEGIKQAGTGGVVIPSLFYGIGASGAITGAYPEDQSERDRWAREGISENSIKIGDDYYQLPAYLGTWAAPALFYAALGRNGGDFGAAAVDVAKIVPSLLPTDQMGNWQDVIAGRTDFGKFMAQTGASAVRAATPVGALLNQVAKSFDSTQNDTNSGNVLENFASKVMSGIPGLANTLPNKTDAEGNELANPDPLAIALGASSTSQEAGVAQTGEITEQTNGTLQTLADYGAFSDPNLKAVITDEDTKKIYNDIIGGKEPTPDDLKKLQTAFVKGVSSTGDDTAYLEREQYDTNLAALNMKRSLMASDPTTKPSDIAKMDTAIKRGEVYKANEFPYDLISEYQSVGVEDWRKMGIPPGDKNYDEDLYNPDMYDKLYAIDKALTDAGASYKKGDLTKPKYALKEKGSGGGGGSKSFSTDFGTLKAGTGAPTVQAYDTLDARSGNVPIIQTVRPNIVHKIGYSG